MNIRRTLASCILAASLAACRADDGRTAAPPSDTAAALEAPSPPPDPAAEARLRAAMETRLAGIEAAQQRLPGLIGSIRRDMRRHLNAAHVAAARRNGVGPVRDSAQVATLVRRGDLVQLPDSSEWWVVRELNGSMPYVTPGTRAALEEIGRRFHARLDEHGLPPFRLDITSVLRTSRQQSALRRRNSNASETTSSHEFGTTLDIAYLSFVAPASLDHASLVPDLERQLGQTLRAELTARLDSLGVRRAPHLEGELGAVLQELQREGLVYPLRERSQPVYHITVVRDPA